MEDLYTKETSRFPGQEESLKYHYDKLQEDELNIQQVKGLNDKLVKILLAPAVVSNCLLED